MVAEPPVEIAGLVERLLGARSAASLSDGTDAAVLAAGTDGDAIARVTAGVWAASAVRVVETRVNGGRVDVRVESGDDAWLLVLAVSPTPARILDVVIYERPPPFAPEAAGTVVVLNGPSSVGKSTLMRAFTDVAATPWAFVDEPAFGRLANRYLAWPDAAGPVVGGFLAALAAAARAGNQIVVSAAGLPQRQILDALAGVRTVCVGLHAPLALLVERQQTQADKYGGLAEGSVGIHDGWTYDLEIDTQQCSPHEAASVLAAHLGEPRRQL
jgi:chloramphenicol 3-O phosphotransferase